MCCLRLHKPPHTHTTLQDRARSRRRRRRTCAATIRIACPLLDSGSWIQPAPSNRVHHATPIHRPPAAHPRSRPSSAAGSCCRGARTKPSRAENRTGLWTCNPPGLRLFVSSSSPPVGWLGDGDGQGRTLGPKGSNVLSRRARIHNVPPPSPPAALAREGHVR